MNLKPLTPGLVIVMPVLDEAPMLHARLTALQPLRARGVGLIVVDGGSRDDSVALARPACESVLETAPGRARQMNTGARAAIERGARFLLFLHADTQLPEDAAERVLDALGNQGHDWGRFDVRIDGHPPMLRVVAMLMNLRSRLSGIATGDQAMFMTREAFEAVGGFPAQELMEDIELSRRLRRLSGPACLRARVLTSGRRWESRGVWRTIVLMWRLRWDYWRGVPADVLARRYR